jgi:hypothetical protein
MQRWQVSAKLKMQRWQVSAKLLKEIEEFEAAAAADPHNLSLRYTTGMLYQLAGQPQQVSSPPPSSAFLAVYGRSGEAHLPLFPPPPQVCDHLYAAYRASPPQAPPELLFHLANNLKAIGENEATCPLLSCLVCKPVVHEIIHLSGL